MLIKNSLRILFGMIFILSGVVKLYPVEPFENLLVDYHLSTFLLAPFIARAIIGIEFLIGLYFILSYNLPKIIFRLVALFLSALTIFLVIQLIIDGNDVNCGCFGSLIEFTPIEGILKNVVLGILLFFIKESKYPYGLRYRWILLVVSFLLSAFTPYLISPVGVANEASEKINEPIDYTELPAPHRTYKKVDFSKGKKIVAFFSLSCPHCKIAAGKLSLLHKQEELSNLYYVMMGGTTDEEFESFITPTLSENVPIIRFNNNKFFHYSGRVLPAMHFIEDGVITRKWTGDRFDMEEVKELVR